MKSLPSTNYSGLARFLWLFNCVEKSAPTGFHPFFEPDVLTATDYYPFGMEMPGRKYNPQNYRYGFNGKENDRSGEWGLGLVQDYGFRLYNPGLGRFLSVDPLTESYPWYTPYQFAGNMPITSIDLDGLEPKDATGAGDAVPYRGPQDDDKIASTPEAVVTESIPTGKTRISFPNGNSSFENTRDIFESARQHVQLHKALMRGDFGHDLGAGYFVWSTRNSQIYQTGAAFAQFIATNPMMMGCPVDDVIGLMGLARGVGSNLMKLRSVYKSIASNMRWADEGAEAAQNLRRLSGSADEGMEFLDDAMDYGKGGTNGGLTVIGSDGITSRNAAKLVPESGVHQILIHGTPTSFRVGGELSAKYVARYLLQKGFKSGTTIRLISCNTGVLSNGTAYQLSRYLRSTVIAPTNKIRVLTDGAYDIYEAGYFRTFFYNKK